MICFSLLSIFWSSKSDIQKLRSWELRPRHFFCQKPNLTSTQRLGFIWKWPYTATNQHHPPTQTQCQQYLSWYWPDFDETLNVASSEHLEQIPIIKFTFVQTTLFLGTIVHIRNISAVITPCWPNFKGRFLKPSLTDANRYGDTCPVNICPGNRNILAVTDPILMKL